MIDTPGVYQISIDEYHAHPALGSSGARCLVKDCPAAYRFTSIEESQEFDIGTATHFLVLQPEEFETRVGIVPFKNYNCAEARDHRDAIRADGRTPLTLLQAEQVKRMRDAVFADPIARLAFQGGAAEQSLFWHDPEFGVFCKARPDYLPGHRRYAIDVKTSTNANPDAFARAVHDYGYYAQAEWYLSGIEAVFGERPQRFAFIVVSKKPPHLVSVCFLDEEALNWGRIQNRYAKGVYAWCLEHDQWPSYQPVLTGQPAAFTISLPGYALKTLEQKCAEGCFQPPQERKAAAA